MRLRWLGLAAILLAGTLGITTLIKNGQHQAADPRVARTPSEVTAAPSTTGANERPDATEASLSLDPGAAQLTDGTSVHGNVRTLLGTPVAHAKLDLLSNDDVLASTSSNELGEFSFPATAGNIGGRVTVEAAGYAVATHSVRQLPMRIVLEKAVEIGGTVFDRKQRALSGAEVTCQEASLGARAHTTTGNDGRFSLRSCPAGHLRVIVRANGYGFEVVTLGQTNAGDSVRDLAITLEPGLHVSGRVVSSDGSGIANAMVFPDDRQGRRIALWRPSVSVVTGPDGTFDLGFLSEGRWQVAAVAGSRVAVASVSLAEESRNVVLTLPRAKTVSGHVLDDAGRPIVGAAVDLFPSPQTSNASEYLFLAQRISRDMRIPTYTTDARGAFQFPEVASGEYRLQARRTEASAPVERRVVAGEVDLVVVLPADRGRLVVRVQDDEGHALTAGGMLSVVRVDPKLHKAVWSWSKVVSSERVIVDDLAMGIYEVSLVLPDGRGTVAESAEVHSGESAHVTLTLPRITTVRGRIVDHGGMPLAGAHVSVARRVTRTSVSQWIADRARTTISSLDGRFELTDGQVGGHVFVSHQEHAPAVVEVPNSGDVGQVQLHRGDPDGPVLVSGDASACDAPGCR